MAGSIKMYSTDKKKKFPYFTVPHRTITVLSTTSSKKALTLQPYFER